MTSHSRDYAAAVRNTAIKFAASSTASLACLNLHIHALAAFHNIQPTPVVYPELSRAESVAKTIVNCFAFADNPTLTTLSSAIQTIGAYCRILDNLPAARKPRLMSKTAHAPEHPQPQPRYVPPGHLDWQTKPAISTTPDKVAALFQRHGLRFPALPLPSTAGVYCEAAQAAAHRSVADRAANLARADAIIKRFKQSKHFISMG